jgi:hypothetical protein
MYIRVVNEGNGKGPVVVLRCPHCGNNGTFERTIDSDLHTEGHWLGIRKCPNTKCRGFIFFIMTGTTVVQSFPALRIDFKKENIPARILNAFEQAITCHAQQCYIASAIMIRRTLEEICADKEAKGDNLKERIKSLKGKIILPSELLDGMDELRLLGNDAAHIEAQAFDEIGKVEIEVGIEFTQEILRAVYQYSSLLTKIRELKKK